MEHICQQAFQLLVLSLAAAAISVTLAKSKLFEPLREKIKERNEWLGELVNCPYCTSHWVSIGLVIIYQPVPFNLIIVDQVIAVFALVSLAAIWAGLIYRAYSPME